MITSGAIFHPERMQVNSRGRAALRDAHGILVSERDPVRVGPVVVRPFQGQGLLVQATVGFAQSRSPTAIKVRPFRTYCRVFAVAILKLTANHLKVAKRNVERVKKAIAAAGSKPVILVRDGHRESAASASSRSSKLGPNT